MVTPGYYPVKGGTETVVRNLSTELNRNGVHTDVLTFNMYKKWNSKWRGETENFEGMTIFRIPGFNWLPIAHSPRLTFGINLVPGRFTNIMKNYDIIHFHEFDLSFPIFSLPVKKPKIFHLHGIDCNFLRKYHLSRFVFKRAADLYVSLTKQMEKNLFELGIPKEKIICVPNGINVKLFCPKGDKEDNLLLFVGRITYGKGLHVLLESLRYIKESVRLVIIGPGDWDFQYYQNILNVVKKENLRGVHRIEYLGALDRANIIEWYQKASVFVLPSFSEASSVVALEALACETPVISTPVGGVPEIVRHHENGILVPLNDPPKLAKAIQYLLDNKAVRTRLGREGRECVMKSFSLGIVVKRLCGIYEKLLDHTSVSS